VVDYVHGAVLIPSLIFSAGRSSVLNKGKGTGTSSKRPPRARTAVPLMRARICPTNTHPLANGCPRPLLPRIGEPHAMRPVQVLQKPACAVTDLWQRHFGTDNGDDASRNFKTACDGGFCIRNRYSVPTKAAGLILFELHSNILGISKGEVVMRFSFFILILMMTSNQSIATELDSSIVYIECFDDKGELLSRGSGAIVSDGGHIVTARHVVRPLEAYPDICRASIGVANSQSAKRLIVPRTPSIGFDIAVVRLVSHEDFTHLSYCEFSDDAVRLPIFISGFPGGTRTGKPSFRHGIVSTSFVSGSGTIETDAQSVLGMSGGPVVTATGSQLVGIVIGASFNAMGMPEAYAILPIAQVSHYFPQMAKSGLRCASFKSPSKESVQILSGRITPTETELKDLKDPAKSLNSIGRCISGVSSHRGILQRNVIFTKPFSKTPALVLGIQNLVATGDLRTSVTYSSLTEKGFTARVVTYCTTKIHSISVSWIAHGSVKD